MHGLLMLDRGAARALHEQIYEQILSLIATGVLKRGSRLTSTRQLAEELKVSRNTVMLALDNLISEGYLRTHQTVGIFVSPDHPAPPDRFSPPPQPAWPARDPLVRSSWPTRAPPAHSPALVSFAPCCTDTRTFPFEAWRRLTAQVLEPPRWWSDRRDRSAGIEPLRQAIAQWLARTRRVIATADEVIVVAGRQQAYNLVAQLFLGVGARVVVEAAGAPGASAVYAGRGAEPLPVAPDERGFDLDSLPAGRVALVHVAPNCQAATDSAMPQKRRERLVAWAAERGTPLLEDDCDGDFRYQGGPATPLKAIDPAGLVLHLGTFQNTLGAGMPLAYLVVPPRLLDRALAARRLLDDGGSWTSQMVLAEFIRGGAYDRHVHRLRNTFLKRRDCLIDALRRHFGDVRLGATGAGRHLLWFLPAHWPAPAAIERQLRQAGIEVGPWDAATAVPRWPHALVLAYAHLTEAEIRDGVARLAGVLGELSVFASAI